MTKFMKRILVVSLLSCLTLLAQAQQIVVSAPSHVAVGENFRIAYTINTTDVSDFRSGNIPSGLEVIAGPYTSQQSSFQVINGHTSSSSSITYTYTLYAEKNGTFTIPAARAVVNGKSCTSRPIRITVSGNASRGNGAPRMHEDDGGEDEMRAAGSRISGSDLFVKVSANKKRVHEQEPILLTYKVYTLVNLTQLNGKMPDLAGFHTQEIPLPQQKSFHIENVNGRNYRCVTWSQYVMYPQMTGQMKIPSITFKGVVVQQNRNVDPFEAFFNGGSGYVEVNRDIVAPGLTIQVDPLPSKPAGFSGGVGRFGITSQLLSKTAKAGEPLTMRVVVSGVGNLKLIKQPIVEFPKDFDKYDPKVTDKTRLTTNGIEGNMVYDYLVVPRNQGTYTIPAVKLTYYDTSSSSYKTIQTQPISVTVAKGSGKGTSVVDYSQTQRNDILPLHEGTSRLHDADDFFFGSSRYIVTLILLLTVFVVLLVVFRKHAVDSADVVKMKGRRANKVATKRLKAAHRLMESGRQGEFYDEVLRALWGYVSNKLNMPVEQLSRDNVAEELSRHQVSQTTIDTFISALDECEYERYAPGDAAGNMNKTYTSAMNAIMDIEDAIRAARTRKKSSVLTLLMLFMLLTALPASAVTKAEGDSAYSRGEYQQAVAVYTQLLHQGVSADIYYNLGNAQYRMGNLPQAVLAYERAHLLSPGDKDIWFNLQFVSSRTIDKITPQNEMFFVTWYRSLVYAMSVDAWAAVSVVALTLACVLLLLYLFGKRLLVREIGFYGSIVLAIVFLLGNVFAWQQKRAFEQRNGAVVISPVVNVKKTPADNSNDAFIIHEGTRVDITDKTMKEWRAVRLADGREGWLKTTTIEEI